MAGTAGTKGGKIIGAQRPQRGALHEIKFPRLGVLGAWSPTGGFHELADGFHRHELGLELADGMTGVHDFEGGVHKREQFSAIEGLRYAGIGRNAPVLT